MSNRPVRLKYLKPKMKIILCIFLLYITAVSVFGQSVPLDGALGQSVKFPAAVKKGGSLMYGTLTLGEVDSGSFRASLSGNYRGRVHWDSSTGLFSLSGLKMEDIGEYKVQNTDQNINTVFQLNVYKDNVPVSKPHVSITRNEYRCTILCTVDRGTGATLYWYREGEKESYSSSSVHSAPDLHLLVPVETGTYTCEAKNSVSNETSDPLTVGAHCTAVTVFGILGQSVKFPAAVVKDGLLIHSGATIGDVASGKFTTPPNERFNGRLHWDSSTGLFSLSGLRLNDSGEYKVQNTDQNITVFQLNVYIPVSKPYVSITHNEYPCTIECTAERGTGVTLSWYREGQKKPYVSSRVESAPHLHLLAPVERSVTYTCEAKNSVSNETASITVEAHCTDGSRTRLIVVLSVVVAFVALIAVICAALYCRFRRRPEGFERRRRAVRTLIQVKQLLDNVDLHTYDETDPPNAVRPFILVKKQLHNLHPHAYGVGTLRRVKKRLDNVDLHDYDETVPPDAVETFIQVKELLDNVDPHVCGIRRRYLGFIRRCLGSEGRNIMTSSPQTEVALNRANLEVGEPEQIIEERDPTHLRDDLS